MTDSQWFANDQRMAVANELIAAGFTKEANEYAKCGGSIRSYKVCSANHHHYQKALAYTCHQRVCPDCAHRESNRLMAQYYPHVQAAAVSDHPDYKLRHIVLTTKKTVHDKGIDEYYRKTWKKIDGFFDMLLSKGWNNAGMGTISSAEFGEDTHHLHYHVLFYGPYIDQWLMSCAWSLLSDNEIVYIRLVNGVRKSVREIVKYATKLTELDPKTLVAVYDCIKGSRRVRSRGIFYNLPKPEPKQQACKTCGSIINLITALEFDELLSVEKSLETMVVCSHLYLIPGNKSVYGLLDRKNIPYEKKDATQVLWEHYEGKFKS